MYITMKDRVGTYELHAITIQTDNYLTSSPSSTYIILINNNYTLYEGTLEKCKELYNLVRYAIYQTPEIYFILLEEVDGKFKITTQSVQ